MDVFYSGLTQATIFKYSYIRLPAQVLTYREANYTLYIYIYIDNPITFDPPQKVNKYIIQLNIKQTVVVCISNAGMLVAFYHRDYTVT